MSFQVGDVEDAGFIRSLPGPFDVILIADTLGFLDDCQGLLASLHPLCTRETRLVIAYFSHLWYPVLKVAEALRLRMPQAAQNVLSPEDIRALVELADFDPVKVERRLLSPAEELLGVGRAMNRFPCALAGHSQLVPASLYSLPLVAASTTRSTPPPSLSPRATNEAISNPQSGDYRALRTILRSSSLKDTRRMALGTKSSG